MNNSYNQNSQSPRYMEIDSNGQLLRQSIIIPPQVLTDLSATKSSINYSNTLPNTQLSNYPYQTPYTKDWCRSVGPFNPYRTWNQEYGRLQNPTNSMSNVYYTGPNTYGQSSIAYDGNWNSFNTTSYSGQSSMP